MADETIGQRLKRLRLDQLMSQRELAVTGVSYAYISRIEAGTRQPSVKALRRLAARLDVTPEYLETGEERTTTDDLVADLMNRTGSGLEVAVSGSGLGLDGPALATAVTWVYDTEQRTSYGSSLTDALHKAVNHLAQIDRLRKQIEEAEREVEAAELALVSHA